MLASPPVRFAMVRASLRLYNAVQCSTVQLRNSQRRRRPIHQGVLMTLDAAQLYACAVTARPCHSFQSCCRPAMHRLSHKCIVDRVKTVRMSGSRDHHGTA